MSVESDNGSASAGTVDATGDTGGTSRGKVQLAGGTTTSTNAGGETIIALGIVADTASGTAMIKTENAGASGVSGLINMITGMHQTQIVDLQTSKLDQQQLVQEVLELFT